VIWRVGLVLVVAVVGYIFVSEATGDESVREQLSGESTEDLTRILTRLDSERVDLESQRDRLQQEVAEMSGNVEASQLAEDGARREIEALGVLSGDLPAHGPGVTLTITGDDEPGFERLLDVVQEARDAGAEAISINDIRIVAETWFGSSRGLPTIEGKAVRIPITMVAIGDPKTLAGGLGIPGGAVERLQAEGFEAVVEGLDEVSVPARER